MEKIICAENNEIQKFLFSFIVIVAYIIDRQVGMDVDINDIMTYTVCIYIGSKIAIRLIKILLN